ncbi:MAG: right-handed parallel beta-helix repeat-containing protein [Candidatus Zixiibacteriota bacterium]|nr:MAG: right-handed parallel beta-helix repeat-containing protein [candidate division Zixibacteria bacterium]
MISGLRSPQAVTRRLRKRQEGVPDAALIIILLIFGLAVTSSATIINIPNDYPTIQQGIDASVNGDTVLVQPGTYYENINFNGHNIVLGSLFLTTGDTSYIGQTVIDGDSAGLTVSFASGEDHSTILKGLTVTNGYSLTGGGINCSYNSNPAIMNNIITGNSAYNGAGIYCFQSEPAILDNLIRNNTAQSTYGLGGGIYCNESNSEIANNMIIENIGSGITCEDSDPSISDNVISDNLGGGIVCKTGSHPVITNNIINNNTALGAGAYGGGICCVSSYPTIDRNEISGNFAGEDGGGIFCHHNCNPAITYNIIRGNTAGTHGGGIHCGLGSSPLIKNNTIIENSASYGGGLLFSNTSPVTKNNILWDNQAFIMGPQIYTYYGSTAVTYCDVQGGWSGEGNIDCDPLFCDPQTGDFHLAENSCCVGAGENGEDIGAFGIGCNPTDVLDEFKILPNKVSIIQNYPNPFNAQTTIRFVLPGSQNVELTIYDVLGRRIELLFDEYREAGVHEIIFDASGLPSGVYFYRLRAGDVNETRRMVILK